MIFKQRGIEINTNLAGNSYEQLMSGCWQIGYISDNLGLDDKNNNNFYKTETKNNKIFNEDNEHRCFKNKVHVKLLDGSTVNKHIIHWVKSNNYFCITNDLFWDQFTD